MCLLLCQLEWEIPFADAVRLYQITCHVKQYLLCPLPGADDGYKLKVALYIGELVFNLWRHIFSRAPKSMTCMEAFQQNLVFSLVCSF